MPEMIIIAGPNGAGKTSFANEYLPAAKEGLVFVNADEIARDLLHLGLPESSLNMRAGRVMLTRIEALVEARSALMFETTLASLVYMQRIPCWRHLGYSVSLMYLRLPSVEHSIERVRRRVVAGGHGISEDIIRRRFDKSLRYLEDHYKHLVDEWYIWDSLEGDFRLAQTWDGR